MGKKGWDTSGHCINRRLDFYLEFYFYFSVIRHVRQRTFGRGRFMYEPYLSLFWRFALRIQVVGLKSLLFWHLPMDAWEGFARVEQIVA